MSISGFAPGRARVAAQKRALVSRGQHTARVIMLMGDVAKKAFHMIAKKATKKNVIPAVSTYKLRSGEIYYEGIRVMPSYIMAGGNILIEKSKAAMAAEDISTMLEIIQ